MIKDNLDWTGLKLNVYVQPGASKTEISGLREDRHKIRVEASAHDGSANRQLCSFLAKVFCVPKSSVSIEQGQQARQKLVPVCGSPDKLKPIVDSYISAGQGS